MKERQPAEESSNSQMANNPGKEFKEIALIVPWQASEAVENFLVELGALGASIERFDLEGSTETVRGYFPGDKPTHELEGSVRAYLKAIEDYFPSSAKWQFSVRVLADKDWQETWKVFFKPIRVTRRIVIKPTWEPYEARGKEIIIAIDPGMAFGTGLHATTRLCLEVIDREIDRRIKKSLGKGSAGLSLLDVGTGSGILAIAAAKLGARSVMGIDIDERAIEVARQNVKHNRVERVVRIGSENLKAIDGCFDIVLANIDFMSLAELKEPLTCHVSQGGRLVLSGIIRKQKEDLREIFQGGEFQLVEEKSREGWSCLVFEQS